MFYLGYEPLKLEKFGGLSTLMDPTNLPPYASPDTQDTEFLPGLVRTRPGLTSLFAALGGNPTVNYLKSYITPTVLLRALVIDSLGNFYKENPIGTLSSVASGLVPGDYANSVSLFDREYLAFGDGKFGIDIPRQFDDTNFDRVSQTGPGVAPVAVDEVASFTIAAGPTGATQPAAVAIAAGPNGATEVGNLVTILTGAPHLLIVGDVVTLAGIGVAGYNGTFPVVTVVDATHFRVVNGASGLAASGGGTSSSATSTIVTTTNNTFVAGQLVTIAGVGVGGYNGTFNILSIVSATSFKYRALTGGLAASGAGTAVAAGNIVAGVHELSVVFVTRQNYFTPPAPFAKWTASGNKRAVISNIPTGPANIIQRILIFTAAGGESFFYSLGDPSIFSSNMVINDNTTTTVTVDFSDAILLKGVNADALFELLELGECVGVTQYSSRLFWWGERNKVGNFNNLSFDGGFGDTQPSMGSFFPFGWAVDPVVGAGGTFVNTPYWGGAYDIVGNGGAGVRGKITQSAYQDSDGNPIILANTSYSVRVRVQGLNLTTGTLHINLNSASGAFTTTGISINAASVTASYVEFTAVLIAANQITGAVPSDLILQVYGDSTINNGGEFHVDCIEIFPTNLPTNATLVRASKVEDPESYDGLTGFLDIAPSNGQAVRAGFVIRNNLYFVKERSFYVTQDDGVNEPNQWTIQEVSNKIGTLSVRGVGLGDEWAVIAGFDGVYYFDGGEPQKISQEIQPTWDSINWSLGHLIDVKVDTKRKRAYIAVPFGASATANNKVLTLDYTDGFGDPNPTNTVSIAGLGRKWSPWAIACNSMNLILRSDGTQQLWFGNGTGISSATGKIYQLDTTGTVFADDGAAINSYWQSGYFQDVGRLVFGPLVANIVGVGACSLILRKGDQGWVTNLRSWTLSPLGFKNMERNLNIETERLALRFGTNAIGAHFSLQGASLYAKEATFATLRGINA